MQKEKRKATTSLLCVLTIAKALINRDVKGYGKTHPPSGKLGNKPIFFQNKRNTEQLVKVRVLSLRKHMKIYGGSFESDIPELFLTDCDERSQERIRATQGFSDWVIGTKQPTLQLSLLKLCCVPTLAQE